MKNTDIEIAVLCGGPGKRMGKLDLNKQKCMLEVEGRPIIEHLFEQIVKAFGRAKVVLSVGYKSNDIRNYFGNHYKTLQLEYTHESFAGTRLALLNTESFIKEEYFLSIDGDTIINGTELLNLVNLKRSNLLGTILVSTRQEIAPTHGLAIMKGRRVLKIDYPPSQSTLEYQAFRLMDTGFYSKKLFEYLKISNIQTISQTLNSLIEGGETIEGKLYSDIWFHFMKPEDLRTHIFFESFGIRNN